MTTAVPLEQVTLVDCIVNQYTSLSNSTLMTCRRELEKNYEEIAPQLFAKIQSLLSIEQLMQTVNRLEEAQCVILDQRDEARKQMSSVMQIAKCAIPLLLIGIVKLNLTITLIALAALALLPACAQLFYDGKEKQLRQEKNQIALELHKALAAVKIFAPQRQLQRKLIEYLKGEERSTEKWDPNVNPFDAPSFRSLSKAPVNPPPETPVGDDVVTVVNPEPDVDANNDQLAINAAITELQAFSKHYQQLACTQGLEVLIPATKELERLMMQHPGGMSFNKLARAKQILETIIVELRKHAGEAQTAISSQVSDAILEKATYHLEILEKESVSVQIKNSDIIALLNDILRWTSPPIMSPLITSRTNM
jgi:hypothetical protein